MEVTLALPDGGQEVIAVPANATIGDVHGAAAEAAQLQQESFDLACGSPSVLLKDMAQPAQDTSLCAGATLCVVPNEVAALKEQLRAQGIEGDYMSIIFRLLASPRWTQETEGMFHSLVRVADDIDTPDARGLTALMAAVLRRNAGRMLVLLKAGADPNRTAPDGTTPLMVATNNLQALEFLLDAGADPNACTKDGHTALLYAVQRNRIAEVRLLVQRGANLEPVDKLGHNALMVAAICGHCDMIRLLKSLGCGTAARDASGKTAADLARRRRHFTAVTLLDPGRAVRQRKNDTCCAVG